MKRAAIFILLLTMTISTMVGISQGQQVREKGSETGMTDGSTPAKAGAKPKRVHPKKKKKKAHAAEKGTAETSQPMPDESRKEKGK